MTPEEYTIIDDDEDCDEYRSEPAFGGVCTCGHTEDEHGWGACGNEGCDCKAGWVEW